MTGVGTALASTITAASLGAAITDMIPFLGVTVLVGLSYTVLRRAIKGAGRGRASI